MYKLKFILSVFLVVILIVPEAKAQISQELDGDIRRCLDSLISKNEFRKQHDKIITVIEKKVNEGNLRELWFNSFLVDRQGIKADVGKILGFYRGFLIVYKSYLNTETLNKAQIIEMQDNLDSLLVGNKEAYRNQKAFLKKYAVDKNGESIIDTNNILHISVRQGLSKKIEIKKDGRFVFLLH